MSLYDKFGPDPDDVEYDEDFGLFVDRESGDAYYDSECSDYYGNVSPE